VCYTLSLHDALPILKSYGGKINLLDQPSNSFKVPLEDTELSMARMAVVPTAHTRLLFLIPVFMVSTASLLIIISSLSILCLDKRSEEHTSELQSREK